ncbi:hypothetical protein C2W64_03651 [Brevibacillus laterosporus]|nr:hypothetical protein C2W64_03651 [Brevibacillus laterosporus]
MKCPVWQSTKKGYIRLSRILKLGSRFIHATNKETTNEIIKRYYPEALYGEEEQ